MFFVDSHCHIDRLNYYSLHKNIPDVLKKAHQNDVTKFLTVSTSISNFYQIKKLFKSYHSVFFSCGIHPLNCHKNPDSIRMIEKSSNLKKVIALGETGLDYRDSLEKKELQKYFFREHIRVAVLLNKPIIVHTRNSIKDTLEILTEHDSKKCIGVFHSFTEDYTAAYKALDLGWYISISGIITFKNTFVLQETVKKIPLDRLLIETDSPYLSPVPYRGKENQPAYLLEIAKKIAALKKINIKDVAEITTKNFYTLFNIS